MSKVESNIWKYQVFIFIEMFMLFLPYIVFYFQQLGFNLSTIMIIIGTFSFVTFIFEIPSGYIADRIGRKNSIILSGVFGILSKIVLYYSVSFYGLAFAHVLLGLCLAFLSGADSAFLYDSLLELNREKEYAKIEGRSRFFGEISLIISTIIASFLIDYGVRNLILINIFIYLFLLIFSFSFVEPKRHKLIKQNNLIDEINNSITIIKNSLKDKKLFGLFFYSFIVSGFSFTIFNIYQPYFALTNVPLEWFGIIFAFFSFFAAITSHQTHDIKNWFGIKNSLIIMPILLSLSLIFSSIFFVWFGFIFFLFRELVRGFIHTVLKDYMNSIIRSDIRATVLSIDSMFSRIGYLLISISFGYSTDLISMKFSLLLYGIVLLILTFVFIWIFNNKPKSNDTINQKIL